eukprot:COSAG06_NODE_45_length_29559_cov_23.840835_3_plen_52_part_00
MMCANFSQLGWFACSRHTRNIVRYNHLSKNETEKQFDADAKEKNLAGGRRV